MKRFIYGALGILLLFALLLPGCSSGGGGGGKEIVVTYSSHQVDSIGNLFITYTPKAGNIYLVLDITVENRGYDTFPLEPLSFALVVNGTNYKRAVINGLENEMLLGVVKNNTSKVSALLFEVPEGTVSFDLQCQPSEGNYTFRFVKQ
jgi:hypothetical protein